MEGRAMARRSNDSEARRWKPADEELQSLLAAFITTNAEPGAPERQAAFDNVHHALERSPEAGWRLLKLACQARLAETEKTILAISVFQDLLACHGDVIFERLEQAARKDDSMLPMLAMVWQGFAGGAPVQAA
jgi:hypothetical protein